MKKFQTIFESHLKTAELKRVRIKLDPIYAKREEYTGLEGYTGYILSEDTENATVYLEHGGGGHMGGNMGHTGGKYGGMIQVIPVTCIEIQKDPKLIKFIQIVTDYLCCIKGIEEGDAILAQLANVTSCDEAELFLKEEGCTPEDLLNIYKGFYNGI